MSDSRQKLMDAAISALCTDPGKSLAAIATAAGVQRMTLHRHFGSRDQLLTAIALHCLEEMDRVSQEATQGASSHTAALKSIVRALVPVGDRFHFLWTMQDVWNDAQLVTREEQANRELLDLIAAARVEGSIAPEFSDAWVLAMIEAVVFSASRSAQAAQLPTEEAGRLAVRCLFDGISRRN